MTDHNRYHNPHPAGGGGGGTPRRRMTEREVEAFKRGIMIAYITTNVREAVEQAFKGFPELRGVDARPNAIASNMVMNAFIRLRQPIPTMEEAILNVDVIMSVSKELVKMSKENSWTGYWEQKDENGKSTHRFSKKDKEELR